MGEWDAEAAEWYARNYGEYATNRLAVEAQALAADSVVVDVGCGTGSALRHAASRIPQGTLIGVDPVPRMLEIARERLESHPDRARIEFRQGSAESLPIDDASADVVFAFDSFDHWQDKPRGLVEVRRVLRPQGRLVVVKDDGVPGAAEAGRAVLDEAERSGYRIASEQPVARDQVSFTIWVCTIPAHV